MKAVIITENAKNKIKIHGRGRDHEVKGYLVGYITPRDVAIVYDALPCPNYSLQNRVSARCDSYKKAQLFSLLPPGVEFVGEYHTHLGYGTEPSGNDWESFMDIPVGCIYDTELDVIEFFDGKRKKRIKKVRECKSEFSDFVRKYAVRLFNGMEDIVYLPDPNRIRVENYKVYNAVMNRALSLRIKANALHLHEGEFHEIVLHNKMDISPRVDSDHTITITPTVRVNIHLDLTMNSERVPLSIPLVAYLNKGETFGKVYEMIPYEIAGGRVVVYNGYKKIVYTLEKAEDKEVVENADIILYTENV